MTKFFGFMMVSLSVAGVALAGTVPEIDASTGAAALAMLSGGMLVLRSRRKK